MTVATLPAPTSADVNDDLAHAFCCNPDRALCGEDLTDSTDASDADLSEVCAMCLHEWFEGPLCGPACDRDEP